MRRDVFLGGHCSRGAWRGDENRRESEAGVDFTGGAGASGDLRPTATSEMFRRYSGGHTGVGERRTVASNSELHLGRPAISDRSNNI